MGVALEAIKGQKTTAEIIAKYGVHATQINTWKKQALEMMPEAFSSKRKRSEEKQQNLVDELYKQIGRLTVERDWLKKTLDYSLEKKRVWIGSEQSLLSIRRQCELLGVNRFSWYYQPVGLDEYNLLLMRILDEQYTKTPFYSVCRMIACLRRLGHEVNPKRVRRLLRTMGLEAVYPKPKLSQPNPDHKIFPYLLRGLIIDRCNQVWSTDITYIRLERGFVYLMAIIVV